jgi:tRNA pseudouridine38-40 synthase
VQGELEAALERARGAETAVTVAGRTDAGVHALGQVAGHPGEPAAAGALNALLGPDLRVLASEPAPDGFDARRDARSRSYRYRITTGPAQSPFERGRALHLARAPAFGPLQACAALLCGSHDFRAFTRTRTDHVRFEREIISADWSERDGVLSFAIEADSFLRYMVRTLVGTMLEVAAGRLEPAGFAALLEGSPRTEAGPTVSAHGLYLVGVRY